MKKMKTERSESYSLFTKEITNDVQLTNAELNHLFDAFIDKYGKNFKHSYFNTEQILETYDELIRDTLGLVDISNLNQKIIDDWVEEEVKILLEIFGDAPEIDIWLENYINHSLSILEYIKFYAMFDLKVTLHYDIRKINIHSVESKIRRRENVK